MSKPGKHDVYTVGYRCFLNRLYAILMSATGFVVLDQPLIAKIKAR